VGDCDPDVAARADRHIPDRYPGLGPLGGIATAIQAHGLDVFVLPGDVPRISASVIQSILAARSVHEDALAVLASSGRPEPCIGLYRRDGLSSLESALASKPTLIDAIRPDRLVLIPVDPALAANANTPDVLRASNAQGESAPNRG
jgi:molybdopterin-guanine dinucleotide biosynthesis protein A